MRAESAGAGVGSGAESEGAEVGRVETPSAETPSAELRGAETPSAELRGEAPVSEAGGAAVVGSPAGDRLASRIAALREALDAGGDRFTPEVASRAREDLEHVEARLAMGVDRTVVALVGGTGSGKSSLFNAISGLSFADVGVRRPTTARPAACVWGGDADALLDFLGVHPERRIRRESPLDADDEQRLGGLVLLDMPDHDSVAPEHARLVDRLLPLVDLLVWVVDPQKYADNVLHRRYLRAMAQRQDGMLVLVNQCDTVTPKAVRRIAADIRRLLEADGLRDVPVLATSVVTGEGIDAVRTLLGRVVVGEPMAAWVAGVEVRAVAGRLAADLGVPAGGGATDRGGVPAGGGATDAGRGSAVGAPGGRSEGERDLRAEAAAVVDRLSEASGVGAVTTAVRAAIASPRRRPALVRPDAPAPATAQSVREDWVRVAGADLPPRWAADLDHAVGDGEALRASIGGGLGAVPLPSTKAGMAWRRLTVACVLVAVAGVVVGLRGGLPGAGQAGAFALALVAALLAGVSVLLGRVERRRAARERAAAFGGAARTAVARAAATVLIEPAEKVRAEHRAVRLAVARGAGA